MNNPTFNFLLLLFFLYRKNISSKNGNFINDSIDQSNENKKEEKKNYFLLIQGGRKEREKRKMPKGNKIKKNSITKDETCCEKLRKRLPKRALKEVSDTLGNVMT